MRRHHELDPTVLADLYPDPEPTLPLPPLPVPSSATPIATPRTQIKGLVSKQGIVLKTKEFKLGVSSWTVSKGIVSVSDLFACSASSERNLLVSRFNPSESSSVETVLKLDAGPTAKFTDFHLSSFGDDVVSILSLGLVDCG
jgi:hypothetical protein